MNLSSAPFENLTHRHGPALIGRPPQRRLSVIVYWRHFYRKPILGAASGARLQISGTIPIVGRRGKFKGIAKVIFFFFFLSSDLLFSDSSSYFVELSAECCFAHYVANTGIIFKL